MNRRGNNNVYMHIKVTYNTDISKNSLNFIAKFSQRHYMFFIGQIMMTGIGQHNRGSVQLQLHHQPEDHLELYPSELIVLEIDFN